MPKKRRFGQAIRVLFSIFLKAGRHTTSLPDAPLGLFVTHTPITLEQVPKTLLEKLEYPYIRFYRTDLINNTDRSIRIVWFDGYFEHSGCWSAGNVRNKVLRTSDFVEWYSSDDIDTEGWIRPGGKAVCQVNWHWTDTAEAPTIKWAYIAVDCSGNDYFTEELVPNIDAIKLK